MSPDSCSGSEPEPAVGAGVVSFFFTCFALVAMGRFVSTVFGVADSTVDSGGVGGVLVADFLNGGVFFAVTGLGVSELRVLMLLHDD